MSQVRQATHQGLEVHIGREHEYDRVKRLLNAGRHPTFIGRDMVQKSAGNGGVLIFHEDGADKAVAMVNPRLNVLTVLCVHPACRGQGIGEWVIRFIKPNWVRAVESAVPWFEARGYRSVGQWKQGRSLRTRVMVRAALIELSGRVHRVLNDCGGSA